VRGSPHEQHRRGGFSQTNFVQESNVINPVYQESGSPGPSPISWVVTYTNPGPDVVVIEPFAICAQLVVLP
jgi:hypothetical protein